LSPHFFISQYFLIPLGLKKEEKIAIKGVVSDNLFVYNQKSFEKKGV
jgi:hypothetical protein